MSHTIDISGLSKAAVLAALHNGAKGLPPALAAISGPPPKITEEEAEEYVKGQEHRPERDRLYFDYLKGRCIKSNLIDDEMDVRLYDRDNGEGAAARALAGLIQAKPTALPFVFRNSNDGDFEIVKAMALREGRKYEAEVGVASSSDHAWFATQAEAEAGVHSLTADWIRSGHGEEITRQFVRVLGIDSHGNHAPALDLDSTPPL